MKNFTTRMGFEPNIAELNGLAIQHLNHYIHLIHYVLAFDFKKLK